MKRLVLMTAATLFAASTAIADPVEGIWRTQEGENGGYAHVKVSPCGDKICGEIVKILNNSDTTDVGRKIIWDMSASGGGKYSGGKIFAPDNGKTYKSKMALSGDALKVSGCVLGICRSQTWKRVK